MKNKNLRTINEKTIIKNNDVLVVDINYNPQFITSCLDGNLVYYTILEEEDVHYLIKDFCKNTELKLSPNDFNTHVLKNDDCFVVIDSSIALEIDDNYTMCTSLIHPSLSQEEIKKLPSFINAQQLYCIVSKDCKKFYVEKNMLADYFKLLKK